MKIGDAGIPPVSPDEPEGTPDAQTVRRQPPARDEAIQPDRLEKFPAAYDLGWQQAAAVRTPTAGEEGVSAAKLSPDGLQAMKFSPDAELGATKLSPDGLQALKLAPEDGLSAAKAAPDAGLGAAKLSPDGLSPQTGAGRRIERGQGGAGLGEWARRLSPDGLQTLKLAPRSGLSAARRRRQEWARRSCRRTDCKPSNWRGGQVGSAASWTWEWARRSCRRTGWGR